MNRRNSILAKVVICLFALNSLTLYVYFHPSTGSHPRLPVGNHVDRRSNFYLKPWPILPSYLPWTENSSVRHNSCEAYFGNGFTRRHDLLRPRGGSGWFRCFFSETLQSSVCEGGKVRMVPERIRMSKGGERLEDVMGRGEAEELPDFDDGAFEIDGGGGRSGELGLGFKRGRKLVDAEFLNNYVPEGGISRHSMRDLIGSIRVVGSKEFVCDQWIKEPVLLVTRFEYANLFHTITDWYSGYVSSRVTGLPFRPHVIFIDGHCKSSMEETWNALFSGFSYAKSFNGSICFRHAVLSPLGYETAMFKGLTEHIDCKGASAHDLWKEPDDQRTARISEFATEAIPCDLDKIEFPDPKILNENEMMVSEYFGMPCESLESETSESFDTSGAENKLHSEQNFENDAFESMQLPKLDSPLISVSTNGVSSPSIPTSTQSSEAPSAAIKSPAPSEEHEPRPPELAKKDQNGESSEGVSSSPFAKPVISVNLEPEQNAVQQQDIVDMYMKSMQQFTESLAKMKLPLDLESEKANPEKNSSSEGNASKNNGSRVFYGSRAFF
ncbi:hypothetical protein SAY87_004093 [Trapa incisa]|uniref:Uncharacterized protein n=1 Tax=Trapa incisa TaxID=236973 RepID=A0AAN7JN71_9MYRT|nr:hypothetical protein SAY87_004093 [Trapa incisa]